MSQEETAQDVEEKTDVPADLGEDEDVVWEPVALTNDTAHDWLENAIPWP